MLETVKINVTKHFQWLCTEQLLLYISNEMSNCKFLASKVFYKADLAMDISLAAPIPKTLKAHCNTYFLGLGAARLVWLHILFVNDWWQFQ